jgi:flagellar biosynthesis/type III secretory pathway protein FliH
MENIPAVKLARPIETLRVVQTPTIVFDVPGSQETSGQVMTVEPISQTQEFVQALEALEILTANLQTVYERAIVEHRQGIAKLAVEIARKILAQKAKDGDYEIESVIAEALNNAPTRQDIVVRLNPQDLVNLQQVQQRSDKNFAGIKFTSDPAIGPAQCVVETPKGKVESLIEEHLEQVARVLSKTV